MGFPCWDAGCCPVFSIAYVFVLGFAVEIMDFGKLLCVTDTMDGRGAGGTEVSNVPGKSHLIVIQDG